jgi:hypothetical protein
VHKTRGERDPALAFPLASDRNDADERRQWTSGTALLRYWPAAPSWAAVTEAGEKAGTDSTSIRDASVPQIALILDTTVATGSVAGVLLPQPVTTRRSRGVPSAAVAARSTCSNSRQQLLLAPGLRERGLPER